MVALQSGDTELGAEPDHTFRINRDGAQVARRQAIVFAEVLDLAVDVEPIQAIGVGTDPHAAFGVFGEAQYRYRIAAGRGQRHRLDGAIGIHPVKPPGGADPQTTTAILHDRADVVRAQSVLLAKVAEQGFAQPEQATVGADPDTAFSVFEDFGDAPTG